MATFKIYDEPESPNDGACLRCMMKPESPHEGAVFRISDEPKSPNAGRERV